MALVIPIGHAEAVISISHTLSSHIASITFGVAGGNGGVFDVAVCDGLQEAFMSTLGLRMDTSCVIGPCSLTSGQDGPALTVTGTATDPGSHTITSLPPNCAALITKATSLGGRRGRGRMFLPWCLDSADVNEGGFIGATPLGLLQAQATNFLAAVNATFDCSMELLHSTGGSSLPDPTEIAGLGVTNLIATQRRRLGR